MSAQCHSVLMDLSSLNQQRSRCEMEVWCCFFRSSPGFPGQDRGCWLRQMGVREQEQQCDSKHQCGQKELVEARIGGTVRGENEFVSAQIPVLILKTSWLFDMCDCFSLHRPVPYLNRLNLSLFLIRRLMSELKYQIQE